MGRVPHVESKDESETAGLQVLDSDGNPVDPAFLYEHHSEAVALAEQEDEGEDDKDWCARQSHSCHGECL